MALVIAMGAFVVASWGTVAIGLTERDGIVTEVQPTGPAWSVGYRAGQPVAVERDEDGAATGWSATIGGERVRLDAAAQTRILRSSVPLALVAFALAIVAVVLTSASPGISVLASMLALPLAAVPLGLQGEPVASTVALGATFVVPAAWAASRVPFGWPRLATVFLLVFATVVWAILRLTGSPAEPTVDGARSTAGLILTLAAAVVLVVAPIWLQRKNRIARVRSADVLYLGLVAGVGLVLGTFARLPELVVLAAVIALVAIYPAARRRIAASADRLVLEEVREAAALGATERERARVASELHDSSMQELSGVIRRLERLPEAAPERDALRDVAAGLRGVAAAMRPPMLDDLGLGPALQALAARPSRAEVSASVVVTLEDATGPDRASRLPADVELELFRICEQAVENALAHARASRIEVAGRITAAEARLQVTDDGVGLSDTAMEAAGRAGRMGLATMRRRATLIGATLDVGAGSGTTVAVAWQR